MDSLARLPQHQAPGGSGPSTTLMQMQGTVLIHISTLLKYDAVLGADWLKYLKSGGLTASPFLLEVCDLGSKAWLGQGYEGWVGGGCGLRQQA
jgi:hypothetical protein